MGYEVNFFYHDKVDGKYKTDERKEFRKKIGSPTEETPLEKLAGAVMTQLARRDIWVVDVEIFEFTKKQISFKDSENGIVIKGRKFNMGGMPAEDIGGEAVPQQFQYQQPNNPNVNLAPQRGNLFSQSAGILDETMQANPYQQHIPAVHQPNNPNINLAPALNRPQMFVRFDPEVPLLLEAKKKNLRFTEGKKYPVYRSETVGTFPAIYTVYIMKDDLGREVRIHAKYFSAANETRLVGDDEVEGGFSSNLRDDGPRLSYDKKYQEDVPQLRPGMREPQRQRPMREQQMIEGARAGYVGELENEMPQLRPGRR